MCVYFEPGQCGVCAALVTFCLSQPKRSRRCVYLCLCVVWVSNVGAAGATPYLWSHFICGPLCDQTCLCPMSLCADVSLSVHRCLRLCLWGMCSALLLVLEITKGKGESGSHIHQPETLGLEEVTAPNISWHCQSECIYNSLIWRVS